MIFMHLNFINMFTKYVYLKYELTLTKTYNNSSAFIVKLCGTTINFYVWGTHLPKKDKHGKNVLVFHVLRIYAGKNRKTKNVGTWGPGAPTFLQRAFFEIFFSKFVKREKLYIFWHGLLFLRVNEWLGQWYILRKYVNMICEIEHV